MSNSVFSDFCQAWVARFPGSELPAAWEEDVRANLKKHKSKVALLREELEKEEMYVEYLDKLLCDIEKQRKSSTSSSELGITGENNLLSKDEQLQNDENKRRSSELNRSQLHLDLDDQDQESQATTPNSGSATPLSGTPGGATGSTFVTVINVAGPKKGPVAKGLTKGPPSVPSTNGTYNKTRSDSSLLTPVPPPKPPKRFSGSRDSLNSVSSPTTPPSPYSTDDYYPHREGLGVNISPNTSNKISSSEEEEEDSRGRPDGTEHHEVKNTPFQASEGISESNESGPSANVKKIKDLMANWENKPLMGSKPAQLSRSSLPERVDSLESRPRRKDSDSSSRGRMGSPSGKSHDSSDSESNWSSRNANANAGVDGESPRRRRGSSGDTRLDRLVRRPSGGSSSAKVLPSAASVAANLKRPVKKPRAKPRTLREVGPKDEPNQKEEPLYDTVANDEPEDEYDNHLLYGTNSTIKSDTIGSSGGGSSSTDLGFDEPHMLPVLKSAQSGLSLTGSGTLSSSDTDVLCGSPRLIRSVSVEEEDPNYVNIHFFLRKGQETSNSLLGARGPMDTIMSDDELLDLESNDSKGSSDNLDGSSETEAQRLVMYRCILSSIIDSEAIYLEGLSVMLQYMKAMKVTLTTPQPVIPKPEFERIFFKIPELHDLHLTFHEKLKKQFERWNADDCIGHTFKMLASRIKIYSTFLSNYQSALDALHRCSEAYPQFADLTKSIKLRTVKGQRQGQSLSLEDLLHKPVARVQKHCLCLQDLIKYTPKTHPDYKTLNEALTLVQSFVNDYNSRHAEELFPHQERPQRHLVKNSFIVELWEGQRKLRHLFLFNDVLVCAKYKASSKKTENFTFQLKWYIPLSNTQTTALRDQIYRLEKEDEWKGRKSNHGSLGSSKSTVKYRKKLNELEAQLVLASPCLVFQVAQKPSGKTFTFFLSSDFERSQWVETLQVLQTSMNSNSKQSRPKMTMDDLQSWITSCRKFLKTNMGSFLMRSPRDEALLVGDLHLNLHHLQGLTRPADLYVVIEVDSYGHYFRKSKSRTIINSMEPTWEEEFVVELDGSENLRILVYEQQTAEGVTNNTLLARAELELSRSWLGNQMAEQRISMNDLLLTCSMKFVTFEETIRRVPSAKFTGLFGTSIQTSTKREKRAVPFIITSCVREVERRGISEVGVYRVSGSAADVMRLKKAYETNPYEAEQLLKECDIHSVAGALKLFLRDLPESLFTTPIYQEMLESSREPDPEIRKNNYLRLFSHIPHNPNQACIVFLIEHMVRVSQYEQQNKMSLHNLATVFGPTMLHAGVERDRKGPGKDSQLATGTVDVMAQAGILLFFLGRRAKGEPIQIQERQV
ncbi:hypothetical protein TCAL_12885 [Tigriopus californicus]|uniref:Active breakpoint cluster region-related protein n=1 Tax=Tigriopus californicus TaxID=6832 RepID=A0A553NVT7_TIGCA|nr:hypothetical protein TCAL_12885 [Tigriopus californicus]